MKIFYYLLPSPDPYKGSSYSPKPIAILDLRNSRDAFRDHPSPQQKQSLLGNWGQGRTRDYLSELELT